mgnify:CR=1 FL=1
MTTEKQEPKFWIVGTPYDDVPHHDDIDAAFESWSYDLYPDPLPETVRLYGYAVKQLPSVEELVARVNSQILQPLDEQYRGPDDEYPIGSPALTAAVLTFAKALNAEYESGTLEKVCESVEKVSDYIDSLDYVSKREA